MVEIAALIFIIITMPIWLPIILIIGFFLLLAAAFVALFAFFLTAIPDTINMLEFML